jgi:hypothetical protein
MNAAGDTETEDLTSYAAVLTWHPDRGSAQPQGQALRPEHRRILSQADATPPGIEARRPGGWGQPLVKPGKLTLGAAAGYERVTDDGRAISPLRTAILVRAEATGGRRMGPSANDSRNTPVRVTPFALRFGF